MSEDSVLIRFTWGVEWRGKSEDGGPSTGLSLPVWWELPLVFLLVASVLCVVPRQGGSTAEPGWLCGTAGSR